jgi:transposase-like protein
VVLIDAIVVKIRDGQRANRLVDVVLGVNLDGERDVLGLWVGRAGGEGAKFWMTVMTELRNRGIADCFIVCCDGLKALLEAILATSPLADVQTCVVRAPRPLVVALRPFPQSGAARHPFPQPVGRLEGALPHHHRETAEPVEPDRQGQ